MMNGRIIITGATGFVGGSLAAYAAASGYPVHGIDIVSGAYATCPVTLSDYHPDHLAKLIADIRPEYLLHAAGTAAVGESFQRPDHDFRSSPALFQQVLEGVRRSGLRPRVVLFSSAAVYGNPTALPVAEDAPLNPLSPYGFHKVIAEALAKEYSACFDIPTLAVRVFSLFGERQRRLLLWEIFEQFCSSPEVVLQGTGEETRDYIHVDDLAWALLRLLSCVTQDHLTVNIASGAAVSVREVAEQIGAILGSDKRVVCLGKQRPGDPLHWRADISAFRRLAAWNGDFDFSGNLARTVAQWRP